jgi:hypothetical protein
MICEHSLFKKAYIDKNKWLYQCSKCSNYIIINDEETNKPDISFSDIDVNNMITIDVTKRLISVGRSILC